MLRQALLVAAVVASFPGGGSRLGDPRIAGGAQRLGGASSTGPTWSITTRAPDLDRLPASLTLNGETQTPTVRYRGSDATATTWPAWGYGETLTLSTGAADPVLGESSPYSETAVDFVGGDYYQDALADGGDVGTSDFAIEWVMRNDTPAGTEIIESKRDGANAGWDIRISAAGTVQVITEDAGGTFTVTNCGLSTDDRGWNTYMYVADRSVSARCSQNGIAVGTTDISGAALTMTTPASLTLGAQDSGGSPATQAVLYFAMWLFDDIGTHDQATVVYQRYAALAGVRTSFASGVQVEPTTQTRASSSFQRGPDDQLYLMGDNAIIVDAVAASSTGHGLYMQRSGAGNLALQSQDFSTSWTLSSATVTTDTLTAPDGTSTGDELVAALVLSTAYAAQAVTVTAAPQTFSVYAQAATYSYVRIENSTDGVNADFSLSACAVGTTAGSPTSTFADSVGDWCRVGITSTTTAAAKTYTIYACNADNDCIVSADGSASIGLWGAQVEASPAMGSYIATTTTAVARAADSLAYSIDGLVSQSRGTIGCRLVAPSYSVGVTSYFMDIRPSVGTAERHLLRLTAGGRFGAATTASAGDPGSSISAASVATGSEVSLYAQYAANSLTAYVDTTAAAEDTTVAVPGATELIWVGSANGGTQIDNHLTDCFIHDGWVIP